MTNSKDPLGDAMRNVADLEEKTEQARRELVRVIVDDYLSRGVPKRAVTRRVGITPQTLRRWLRAYGYGDAVESPTTSTAARRSP